MYIVTFYSYKGGAGRTSALVNVAFRLAARGKRVFIIDFDLEAPGVDSYEAVAARNNLPGLVEYISAFTATGKVPDIRDFVSEAMAGTAGKVLVMRGGRKDEEYKTALGMLDWKILYRQRKGFLLMENLKASIEQTFEPDYLFIDARTGMTDISGICTLQLPHLVVMLFSLNVQSVVGVANVMLSIRNNKLNRDISTLLVASPVPDTPELAEARYARFEWARQQLGRPADVVIPYDPVLAFGETIVDGNRKEELTSQLSRAYDALSGAIVGTNPSDIITLLNKAELLVKDGQHELAESHYRNVLDAMPNRAEAWLAFGKFEMLRGRYLRASECFEKAHTLASDNLDILSQLTLSYSFTDQGKCKAYLGRLLATDQNAERISRVSNYLDNNGLTEIAIEGYSKAAMLENGSGRYISLGEAQMRLRHHRQAADAYRRALELDPNSLVSAFNLAVATERAGDQSAIDYYSKAIAIFEQTKKPNQKTELANSFEAMSRAYLATGKIEKGMQLLQDALTIARELPNAKIFSSMNYEYVPQSRFIAEVAARLEQVQRKNAKKQFDVEPGPSTIQ